MDVPKGDRKELRNMTEMKMTAIVRKLNGESFDALEKVISEERERRHTVAKLVGEINEKLYELSGLLTDSDSLLITNNLTGEIMSDMIDWDEPEDDKLYLAPELDVKFAVGRKPRCPGAPADCHECDGCPWD
jgi:hypothetical protein